MAQKRLMLLGGLRYLKPVIDAAHKQGYYVITADYLPNNIAHKWSDEYCNVSIIDKEAVLREAQRLKIDGIMSFACDPGVVAASYVQNKMGLPSFGPFESVEILQNKDRFRAFLQENGFNCPWSFGVSSWEETQDIKTKLTFPLIVKPTDSAGSKGVTRVDDESKLKYAVKYALDHSLSGRAIIENFLEKKGCSSDSDSFVQDGVFKYISFSAQRFDENAAGAYVPAAFSWPAAMRTQAEAELQQELQRLINLLKMKTAVYNIETRECVDGKAYIMEVSPRGGGNRLAEMVRYAAGVDMITAIARYCVGDSVPEITQRDYDGHWAEVILHADKEGLFDHLEISEDFSGEVVERDLWVEKGDEVKSFLGANDAIGTLVLKFQTADELEKAIINQHAWLKVVVK